MNRIKRKRLFQMWEPYRQTTIFENEFLLNQINKRLLSQFISINEDADKAAHEWSEIRSSNFNPDTDDEGSVYEEAQDHGIRVYALLSDLHEQTRLSLMASIYHHWDKTIRTWLVDEIRHWHRGENVPKQIWSVNLDELINFLDSTGLAKNDSEYIKTISKYRHVVNVYKHGKGSAFDTLKNQYPNFFKRYSSWTSDPDHTHLTIEDKDLKSLSEAIADFWKSIPAEICDADEITPPKWFRDAQKKDAAQS